MLDIQSENVTRDALVGRIKDILAEVYGERLAGVVLYGSEARDAAESDSDLDVLVLLRGAFDHFVEMSRITAELYQVQIESDRLISAKPASVGEYESGAIQLYRNAKREGILV